ncbi:MAG: hypothetical protein HOO96_15015, partial [Polyangiaceae bacterium]|nr:hypothetical protein [Polyangiaceae bacterium]
MRASVGLLLAAAACASPRPVSAPPAAVSHIIVGADAVRVDGAPVARLEDGVFPASERARRFEILRVVEALRATCAATGKNPMVDVDGSLPYETLFGLTFSMARAGCRGVDLRLASQAGTVAHRFPRSTDGVAPSDGPPVGGDLGLTMSISATSVTLWSRDGKLGSEGSPMVLDEPSTPARAQRLTAALRRIVDARWPGASGERRSQADRQIDVRADATLRAADLLPLLR